MLLNLDQSLNRPRYVTLHPNPVTYFKKIEKNETFSGPISLSR